MMIDRRFQRRQENFADAMLRSLRGLSDHLLNLQFAEEHHLQMQVSFIIDVCVKSCRFKLMHLLGIMVYLCLCLWNGCDEGWMAPPRKASRPTAGRCDEAHCGGKHALTTCHGFYLQGLSSGVAESAVSSAKTSRSASGRVGPAMCAGRRKSAPTRRIPDSKFMIHAYLVTATR